MTLIIGYNTTGHKDNRTSWTRGYQDTRIKKDMKMKETGKDFRPSRHQKMGT